MALLDLLCCRCGVIILELILEVLGELHRVGLAEFLVGNYHVTACKRGEADAAPVLRFPVDTEGEVGVGRGHEAGLRHAGIPPGLAEVLALEAFECSGLVTLHPARGVGVDDVLSRGLVVITLGELGLEVVVG